MSLNVSQALHSTARRLCKTCSFTLYNVVDGLLLLLFVCLILSNYYPIRYLVVALHALKLKFSFSCRRIATMIKVCTFARRAERKSNSLYLYTHFGLKDKTKMGAKRFL